jgi:nitrite reductase/ring-hydroxylating ferredoxin subunit
MSEKVPPEFVRVAHVSEVPPGACIDVEVGDDVLVIAHVDDEFYALSAWCTHQGTSLALGTLTGHTLTCYAHLWRYDVRTGEPIWPPIARVAPGYRLRVYPIRVEGDEIYVSPGR